MGWFDPFEIDSGNGKLISIHCIDCELIYKIIAKTEQLLERTSNRKLISFILKKIFKCKIIARKNNIYIQLNKEEDMEIYLEGVKSSFREIIPALILNGEIDLVDKEQYITNLLLLEVRNNWGIVVSENIENEEIVIHLNKRNWY